MEKDKTYKVELTLAELEVIEWLISNWPNGDLKKLQDFLASKGTTYVGSKITDAIEDASYGNSDNR